MTPALAIEGLSVRRGEALALDAVSLRIEPGSFVGLIGPNGAGKTTLIRAALGLIPAQGRCDLAALPPAARARRAAYLPQTRDVAWPVTVETLVRLGRRPHHDRRAGDAAVRAALDRMDLAHLAQRPATRLSGGELARALIARVLAQDTPLILADEPTAALDPAHEIAAMRVFSDLARQGRAVVASMHDLGQAARWCDRLVLLDRGRIAADGRPAEVLTPENLRASFGVSGAFLDGPDGPVFVTLPG